MAVENFYAQKEQMFKNLLTSEDEDAIMKSQKRTDVLLIRKSIMK